MCQDNARRGNCPAVGIYGVRGGGWCSAVITGVAIQQGRVFRGSERDRRSRARGEWRFAYGGGQGLGRSAEFGSVNG